METSQSSTNQNLTGSEVQPQQTGSNQKLFVAVVISVLLTAMFTGSAVYFWQKSANEKAINSLGQKIASLEEQISTMKNVPTVVSDPTVNWKRYTNEKYKFTIKHPPALEINEYKEEGYDFTVSFNPREEMSYATIQIKKARSLQDAIDWKKSQIVTNPYHDKNANPYYKFYSESKVTIETVQGYKISYEEGPFSLVTYIVYRNGYVYFVTATPERIEFIISTFKFLE